MAAVETDDEGAPTLDSHASTSDERDAATHDSGLSTCLSSAPSAPHVADADAADADAPDADADANAVTLEASTASRGRRPSDIHWCIDVARPDADAADAAAAGAACVAY